MAETSLHDNEHVSYPYWRRIWQITSGILTNTTEHEVKKTLFAHQQEIVKGVLLFKSNAVIDIEKLKSELQQSAEVNDFLIRASDIMFVNADVGWLVLKSYIVNDYCGSLKTIQKLKYEMEIIKMLKMLWRFFSSERMFLLKTLKHILLCKDDPNHTFSKVYKEFVDSSKQSIWKSLMAQFSYLIHEMKAETAKMHGNDWMKYWMQRNSQETTEVLHCMIMCTREESLGVGNFYDLLVLCKKHGFGTEPLFRGGATVADKKSINNITLSEGALLLCVANQLWFKNDPTWYDHNDKLRAEIDGLNYRPIDGAVSYIWAMLNLSLSDKKIALQNNCEKLGMKAAQLNCYQFFDGMVRSRMFEETDSLIGASVQDAVVNLFTVAFENVIAHPMFEVGPIASTLNHILKTSFLCDKFFSLSERIGVVPLWSTIVEQYPQNIFAFCQLAEGIVLSESKQTQGVIDLLGNLSYFTEEYIPDSIGHSNRLTTTEELEIVRVTYSKICNFGKIRFEIPENTTAVITREATYALIHYQYNTSFWNMIPAELNRIMDSCEGDIEGELPLVLKYLQLVLAALKVDKCYQKRMEPFSRIYQILFALMERMAEDFRNPSLTFIAICFDIFSEALKYHRKYIQTQFEIYKLLPVIRKTFFEFNQIYSIDFMEHGKLGKLLIRNEYPNYDVLLIAYLKFLRSALLINDGDLQKIEMPGVVFILKEIYPYLISWFNKSNRQSGAYIEVVYEIVQFLFEIFGSRTTEISPSHTQLHLIVYRFFVNEMCGREWLRMLYVANSQIQTLMEEETNWNSGRGIKYISSIQKVMSILVRLLAEKAAMVGEEEKTPLEHVMYYESDGIHAIQAIASFVNHPFNESIPILAVRLLKKCTTELQMSMLAALNLEPDQVRMLFVQRLRDHLEDDDLKLAIIEFITSCIPKQSGMTEAFFKISDKTKLPLTLIRRDSTSEENRVEPGSSAFNEGIGAFLVEYLYTFNNINCPINIAIFSRIMKVFHTLWVNQKEILITYIIKDADFWPSICSPIFKEFCLEDKTYAEIFNIIAKEIHKKRGLIDDNLKVVLKTFFSYNHHYFDNWMKYCCLGEIKYPESVLILAIKDFLVIGAVFLPSFFQDATFKLKILDFCRTGLKYHILHMDNACNMAFMGELYTFLLKTWDDVAFRCDEQALYTDTVTIMCNIKPFYSKLPNRFLEVILAMVMRTIRGLKSTVASSELTTPLIECIGSIVMLEYRQYLEIVHSKPCPAQINDFQLRVAINILNELVAIYNTNPSAKTISFFFEVQFLDILYDCVKMFISRPKTLELAKLVFESLIVYVHSPNSNDFLLSEIQYKLWEITIPPPRCTHPGYLENSGIVTVQIVEWWLFYRKVLIFLTLLLRKHAHMIIHQIMTFVALHEEYLVEILLLERYTVNDTALDLIKHTLMFVKELLNYKSVWNIEHEESFKSILDAVKMSLNYSSSIIVRPAALKFSPHLFEDLEAFEAERTDLLVQTIEHLTDIICLATSCYLKLSPPLFQGLGDDTDYSTWPMQVGTSFGVPNFSVNNTCELTFGMLFCVSSVYVRILQQIPGSHKRLNVLMSPREILVARKGRLSVSKSDEKMSISKSSSATTIDTDPSLTAIDSGASLLDKDSSQSIVCSGKRSEPFKRTLEIIRIDSLSPMCVVSAVENFTAYANPAKTVPWYSRLSEEKAMRALELVMTLIGSQVSHIIYQQSLANRECRLIKRELASELQSFHELVRRRVAESQRYATSERNILFRKKFGIIEPETLADKPSVEVIRAIPSKRSLDMCSSSSSTSVTPVSSRTSISVERTIFSNSTNGLFEVRLANDDYLHFLSVWFQNVLHYEENCLP